MKFARFEYEGIQLFGIVEGQDIIRIDGSLVEGYNETNIRYQFSDVRLLPPIVPTKIVCIGQNYLEHLEEIGATPPEVPLYFLKPPSSLVGPADDIIYPRRAERVDYEGELAVIIKEKMKDVPEHEALSHVLGYSCFNDVTERTLVSKDPFNLTRAKSFDTFAPLGPYVATDIDPNNVDLKTYLNGKIMQEDNTKNCLFTVQYLLHYLSQCLTLCPGDIVTTGTPKGIAPIKPGDVVEVEIQGIGKLSNMVKAADAPLDQ